MFPNLTMKENDVVVLYVDDESTNLYLFKEVFRRKFTVVTALSGQEALRVLEEKNEINVVISDMRMPEMNGLEFIRLAHEKYKNIKYALLTGLELMPEMQEALDSQLIFAYFAKPFNRLELEVSIRSALNAI
jgi:two-component system response regulator (stage 0 sporulation protein F)